MPNFPLGFQAMGSHIHVWLNTPTIADAQILNDIPVWFEQWEKTFSRFRPDSELAMLNASAGQWVRASPAMLATVAASVQMSAETRGLFNPLILPALETAGYDHSFTEVDFKPGRSRHDPAAMIADWREISIDHDRQAIRLPDRAQIDLGGIAKGWAAQQAADRLSTLGACLIDAGGDIVAKGAPDDSGGWLVSIHKPDGPGILYTLLLTDSAVATSGTDYRHWIRDGKVLHHLIDPRTGLPSESGVRSATVIAPEAVQAEAWAKAALISGTLPLLPAVLVHQNGTIDRNSEVESLCITNVQ